MCGPKVEFGITLTMLPCNGCSRGSNLSHIKKAFILNIELPLLLNFTSSDIESIPTRLKFVTMPIQRKTMFLSGLDFRSGLVNGFIGFQ